MADGNWEQQDLREIRGGEKLGSGDDEEGDGVRAAGSCSFYEAFAGAMRSVILEGVCDAVDDANEEPDEQFGIPEDPEHLVLSY